MHAPKSGGEHGGNRAPLLISRSTTPSQACEIREDTDSR